jgi:hypothetical protein
MTASTADYYGFLGLTSDATLADVKRAYRQLARQHHPDRNNADPGAIDRFRRITGTLTKILLIQTTPVTHLRGWYGERRPHPGRRRSVASPVTIPRVRRSGGSPRSGDDQSPAWWQT